MNIRFLFKLGLFQIVIALILFIIYGLDKGFDLTDESFLAMIILDPENSPPAFTYHKLLNLILMPFSPGLITFRLIRLVLSVGGGLVLGYFVSKWIHHRYKNPLLDHFALICIGLLAVLHGYALYPQTISYNNLSQLWLVLFTALLFKRDIAESKAKNQVDLVLGLLMFLLFITKITSAIALLPFWLISITVQDSRIGFDIKRIGHAMFWFGLGFLFFFLLHSLFIQSIVSWLSNFKELARLAPRSLSEMMHQYFLDIIDSLSSEVLLLVIPLVAILLVEFFKHKIQEISAKWPIKLYELFVVCIYILFLLAISNNAYIIGGNIQYFKLHITILGLLLLVFGQWFIAFLRGNKESFKEGISKYWILILLFILPAIGSVGTDNDLVIQITQHMFSWIILIVLLLEDQKKDGGFTFHRITLVAVLVVIMTVQIFDGSFLRPYRIKGGALAQTESIKVGNSQMKVDPEIHRTISELRNLMQTKTDFDEDPVISLTGMPGLSYLLDGKTIGNSWTKNGLAEANCFNWKRHTEMDLSRTVIISDDIPKIPVANIRCMQEIGIPFPDDYVRIGFVNVYVYRLRYAVFVPRKMLITP